MTEDADGSDTVENILSEMIFFSCCLAVCEAFRWLVNRRGRGTNLNRTLLICSLVLAWYTASITLILFNTWVLTAEITCPTFYTTTHMCFKGVLALSYYLFVGREPLPSVSAKDFVGFSLVGVFAALDIMFSNYSLTIISASFYTFLKSASLIFVLIIGIITFVEPVSMSVISTVVLVTAGMFLMAYGEADLNLVGVFLVLASELFAAFRWIVTQMLVQEQKISAMGAVLYMSPAATLSLIPLVIAREMGEIQMLPGVAHEIGWVQFVAMFTFPGFLSFLLLLVEVQLVVETSSLTLSVFGNLKSIVTILFSVAVFKDAVSVLQWVGMLVASTGMLAYSHARGEWMAEDATDKLNALLACMDVECSKDALQETMPIVPKTKATEQM